MFKEKKKLTVVDNPAPSPQAPSEAPSAEAPAENRPRHSAPPAGEVNAYFGKGSKFSGKLSFEGIVRVDGKVEGEIQSNDKLIIGDSAEIQANITVRDVSISGEVQGDVIAEGRIEINRSGKLYGNIRTPSLVIHEGALFEGQCTMSTGGTNQEEKKKPVAKAKEEAPDKKEVSAG